MGCKICKKEKQEITSFPKIEKIELVKSEDDEFKFDPRKARKLIKYMLSEDKLYHNSLNPILLFNDEQLENLFQGNDEYGKYPYHNIPNQIEFKNLIMKFEDHSNLLYEWYKDESKYDNLIKLWKQNLCIYKMREYSEERLEQEFQKMGISDTDSFITDFRSITNGSLESKASNISNWLKDEYNDFYSLITSCDDCKNDKYLSNKENQGVFKDNFQNLMKKLAKSSLPLIKNYAKEKFLNLNTLSKIQLKSGMLNKFRNKLIDAIIQNKSSSNPIGFDNVLSLVSKVKNGNALTEIIKQTKAHFSNPCVNLTNLAISFMNLAVSVKTYYTNSVEFDEKTRYYSNRMDEINKDFELHKKQIGLLNLDNPEECLKKIEIIGKKIYQDKKRVIEFVENIDNEERSLNEDKKKSGIKKTVACGVGVATGVVGGILTGGLLPLAGAVVSGIAMGINIANLAKIKKQLNIYRDYKKKENAKYDEIENSLAELNLICNKINRRYIPSNLLEDDD